MKWTPLLLGLLALGAGAGELVGKAPPLDPYGTQMLLKIQASKAAKKVTLVGFDENAFQGNTLTVTIDGKAVTLNGKPSRDGWSGVGVGDGKYTDSMSVQRVPDGYFGSLRLHGVAHEVRPLGRGVYALVELDTTRREKPKNMPTDPLGGQP